MKKITLLLFVICSLQAISQEKLKINGVVKHQSFTLEDVNVSIVNSKIGTTTNSKGEYEIEAKAGDVIKYSYVGLETKSALVQVNSKVININLKAKDNEIEEVKIRTSESNWKVPEKVIKMGSYGINPHQTAIPLRYISGDKLNKNLPSIAYALQGKFPGLVVKRAPFGDEIVKLRPSTFFRPQPPVLWDVDGVLFNRTPQFNLEIVKHVVVLNSLSATTLYGSQGAGGVIVISTIHGENGAKDPTSKENAYTNKYFYKGDAIEHNINNTGKPIYISELDELNTKVGLKEAYNRLKDTYNNFQNFHIVTENYILNNHNNKEVASQVLKDLEAKASSNYNTLKSLAYAYDELEMYDDAIRVYKEILTKHPKKVQSYRDLANAYLTTKDYKKAWDIYRYYLIKGFEIEKNPIGEMISSEMTYVYLKKNDEAKIKAKMKGVDKNTKIESDVRIVFEWNAPEAEFILEFVNPSEQIFKVEHTIAKNDEVIENEIEKGYNSQEFFIEDIMNGDWKVNLTYFGNATHSPIVFKTTTYYNWGKPNQKQITKLFNITLKNKKIKLLNIKNKSLNY